jgi:hypothetical protein
MLQERPRRAYPAAALFKLLLIEQPAPGAFELLGFIIRNPPLQRDVGRKKASMSAEPQRFENFMKCFASLFYSVAFYALFMIKTQRLK